MVRSIHILLALLGMVLVTQALPRKALIALRGYPLIAESLQANQAADPGETLTYAVQLQNAGLAHGTNISARLEASPGITPLTTMQEFGEMPTNGPVLTREFSFTVTAGVGEIVQARVTILSQGLEIGGVVWDVPVGPNLVNFSSLAPIRFPAPDSNGFPRTIGPAVIYPSVLELSNLVGTIAGVRLTLHNFTHEFGEDVNIMLSSPLGTNFMLMSDCGGPVGLTNVNLTFDSTLTNALTTQGLIESGVYSPSDYNFPNTMDPPAPAPPPSLTYLSQLYRTNPNGSWRLYLDDILLEDDGVLAGGWSLTLRLQPPPSLTIVNNGNGQLQLTLVGTGRRSFLLESSTNLTNWVVLGQTPSAADSPIIFDTVQPGQPKFYRARRNSP